MTNPIPTCSIIICECHCHPLHLMYMLSMYNILVFYVLIYIVVLFADYDNRIF